jgi:hypothetical protein
MRTLQEKIAELSPARRAEYERELALLRIEHARFQFLRGQAKRKGKPGWKYLRRMK